MEIGMHERHLLPRFRPSPLLMPMPATVAEQLPLDLPKLRDRLRLPPWLVFLFVEEVDALLDEREVAGARARAGAQVGFETRIAGNLSVALERMGLAELPDNLLDNAVRHAASRVRGKNGGFDRGRR
jgi:hypothetical protein